MDRLSAVVITKNEGRNVERCLRSLAPVADEIVVVDDFSTDDTASICQRMGARVVQQEWLGFGEQKNFGNGLATNEWILSVDADEVLDPFLQRSLLEAKEHGLRGVYEISRLNYYFGAFVRHGLEYPDRKIRLFQRSAARWNRSLVHEGLDLSGRPQATLLDGHLLHYTYDGFEAHFAKANRYSTLAACDSYARGVRPSVVRVVIAPFVTFFRAYVLKRGFLDGAVGLVLAVDHAAAAFLKHAKLWELHRNSPAQEDR